MFDSIYNIFVFIKIIIGNGNAVETEIYYLQVFFTLLLSSLINLFIDTDLNNKFFQYIQNVFSILISFIFGEVIVEFLNKILLLVNIETVSIYIWVISIIIGIILLFFAINDITFFALLFIVVIFIYPKFAPRVILTLVYILIKPDDYINIKFMLIVGAVFLIYSIIKGIGIKISNRISIKRGIIICVAFTCLGLVFPKDILDKKFDNIEVDLVEELKINYANELEELENKYGDFLFKEFNTHELENEAENKEAENEEVDNETE